MSQQPCFPVSKKRRSTAEEGTISFQDVHTLDAQTYLSRVVAQASQLPEYFTASNAVTMTVNAATGASNQSAMQRRGHSSPATKTTTTTTTRTDATVAASSSAASLAYLLSPQASLTPPPSTVVLPASPRAWVDACCADFTQLRAYVQTLEAHVGRKERRFPYKLPPLKDRAAWHEFCVGVDEAQGNVGSYFGDDDDDDDDDHDNDDEQEGEQNTDDNKQDEEEEWRRHLPATGYKPETSLLLQMDQVMVNRIISHLAYYSQQGWHMTTNRATWCYALLARLETPIHREQAVVLYDWLKALTAQRAAQSRSPRPNSDGTVASLNLIITIVAIYFEQGGGFAATMQIPARKEAVA